MKRHKKKFVKKGFVFILLVISLLCILNMTYLHKSTKNWEYFKDEARLNDFLKTKNQISYLFIGDSHANSIDFETAIKNSFNFAVDGEGFVETYYRFKYLLENKKTEITTTIIEIDPQRFFKNAELNFREEIYFERFLSLKNISQLTNRSLKKIYLKRYFPIAGIGNILIKTIESHYQNKDFSTDDMKQKANKKVKEHFKFKQMNEMQIDYFKKVLNLVKKHNISLILIQYPLSRAYNEAVSDKNIPYRTKYYNHIFNISSEFKKICFLDYYDVFFDNPNYFKDSDHLNDKGANILAMTIKEDLKKLNESCSHKQTLINHTFRPIPT